MGINMTMPFDSWTLWRLMATKTAMLLAVMVMLMMPVADGMCPRKIFIFISIDDFAIYVLFFLEIKKVFFFSYIHMYLSIFFVSFFLLFYLIL